MRRTRLVERELVRGRRNVRRVARGDADAAAVFVRGEDHRERHWRRGRRPRRARRDRRRRRRRRRRQRRRVGDGDGVGVGVGRRLLRPTLSRSRRRRRRRHVRARERRDGDADDEEEEEEGGDARHRGARPRRRRRRRARGGGVKRRLPEGREEPVVALDLLWFFARRIFFSREIEKAQAPFERVDISRARTHTPLLSPHPRTATSSVAHARRRRRRRDGVHERARVVRDAAPVASSSNDEISSSSSSSDRPRVVVVAAAAAVFAPLDRSRRRRRAPVAVPDRAVRARERRDRGAIPVGLARPHARDRPQTARRRVGLVGARFGLARLDARDAKEARARRRGAAVRRVGRRVGGVARGGDGVAGRLRLGDASAAAAVQTRSRRRRLRRVLLTLVPIRPRSRGERRSLRTFSPGVVSLRPSPLAFDPDSASTPFDSTSDAFRLRPDVRRSYGPSTVSAGARRVEHRPAGRAEGRGRASRRGEAGAGGAVPGEGDDEGGRRPRRRRASRSISKRHTSSKRGVVCFSFDATKRRGKTLGDIHVPVPGYEEKMRAAVARVFAGLKHDKPLWRANWALQNSGAFCARVRFSPIPSVSTFDRVGPFQLTDARTHRIARIRRDRVHEPRVAPDQPRHRRRDKQSGGRGEDRRPGC